MGRYNADEGPATAQVATASRPAGRERRGLPAGPVRDDEYIQDRRADGRPAVPVNQGLLELLDTDEVEGVLAHEISHVKHRDILISTVAATMAGALSMLAQWLQISLMFGGYGGRDRDDEGMNPLAALVTIIV